MATTDDAPDARYFGIHVATIVDNVDPRGQGRVRLVVPGLLPPDGPWAWPISLGGGAAGRGVWDVPPIGATAYVFFLGGDPERPRYLGGHWAARDGATEVPRAVSEAIAEDGPIAATKVKVWETAAFELVFDEREGRERVYFRAKDRGESIDDGSALMVELDQARGILSLSGTVAVIVRTLGLVDVRGLRAQVQERTVTSGINKPI